MKKLVCITGVILISCLIISSVFSPSMSAKTTQLTNNTNISSTTMPTIFIVTVKDNKIIVYEKGNSTPYLFTDSNIDSLPESDKIQLKKGIEVYGKNKLNKTLEDYCS